MTYLLRDIPDSLWQEVKHIAIDKKISIKSLILLALQAYVKNAKRSAK